MPDMGLGNSRYELVLAGNAQQLRLLSWDAESRVDQTIPFEWKPDTWYHMRLTVSAKNGKGVIQAKVWPTAAAEPAKWTAELEDAYPNTEGAPFLYGFSTGDVDATHPGSAIYYDNLKIVPNGK